MMNFKLILFSFLLLFMGSPLMATNYSLSGQISIDQQSIPPGGVSLTLTSLIDQQTETINTDDDGAYSFTFDVDTPDGALFMVEVYDECNDLPLIDIAFVEAEGTGTVDFVLCLNGGGPVDCGCPTEIDEVCVEVFPGLTIPFPNACEAECAGYTAADFVECIDIPVDTTDHCGCTCDWDPVCIVIDSTEVLTFPNACLAECEGYDPAEFEDCGIVGGGDDCGCPLEGDIVCVEIEPGIVLPFPNACIAECVGFDPIQFVDCDVVPVDSTNCNCPFILDPVCVEVDPGVVIPFPNLCEAECAGYTAADVVDCETGGGPCGCPTEIDEVCVEVDLGVVIPFPNSCEAECAGFDPADFVDCETGGGPVGCGCPTEIDEVCIEVEPGLIFPFPNLCEAECAGYTAAAVVDCEVQQSDDCQAFFLPMPSSANEYEVQFLDLSFATANNIWDWSFGDGTSSTEQNPIHTYTDDGIYEVTLTIGDTDCTSTFMMSIWVGDNGNPLECQAIYFPEVNGFEVAFLDFSIGENESWSWDFGDGNTSTEKGPVHTYAQEGIYMVSVETITKDGCVSEFQLLVDLETGNLQGNAVPANRTTSTAEPVLIEASKLSPNPAVSELYLDLEVKAATNAQVNILSIDGRVLQSSSESLNVGQERLAFEVSDLPQGMYFLQVQTGKNQTVLKFVKQ